MQPVSVLFTRSDSIYNTLDVDCWDIERDARKWPGGNSIIAHPPCRAWGQLSHFAKPRPDEKELAIYALQQVRKWGGVLEHPRASRLWKDYNLPLGKEVDGCGGFTLCVNQSWWGHRAEKKTLLYISGCSQMDLPPIPLNFHAIQYTIASNIKKKSGRRVLKEIPKKEREATPVEFAKWLIEVAKICKKAS